ncbi:nuclease SbcCD subunit C [Bacteroidia bacterium]|nr:nuclease SbcCD subunit C [Bacteroidia bacterium]
MKILAIRGKNLASLEDVFELDFTVGPLCSAGIFAITGQTGSGKSTILDALCLPLFDDTPRMSQAKENINVPDVQDKTINQKDCRIVLRRGAAEGFAEVDFESLGGEKFRSTWSVKRARGKADGALQNTEIRLINRSCGEEVQGRKTELLAKITELIGLTFEQFTRAVLLAQGDFATFLKAKQSEKAELLEKLTGTDIYSRISMSIFEKSKTADQDYQSIRKQIQDVELLTDEQIETYNTEKANIEKESATLKMTENLLTAKIRWIDDTDLLHKAILQAEASLADAQKVLIEAKPRYDHIAQIESVQEIRDTFRELQGAKKQVENNRNGLKQKASDWEDVSKKLLKTDSEHSILVKSQEALEKEMTTIEPIVIRARAIDVQLIGAQANVEETTKEYEIALTNKAQIEKSIQKAEKEKEVNEKTIEQEKERLIQLHQESERLNNILSAEIVALRAQLKAGMPCPVCGSLHHPTVTISSEESLKEEELRMAKEHNCKQIAVLTETIDKRKTEITRSATLLQSEQKLLTEAKQALTQKEKKKTDIHSILINLQKERSSLLDGKSVDAVEKSNVNKKQELAEKLKQATDTKTKLHSQQELLNGVITQIKSETTRLELQEVALQQEVGQWLTAKQENMTVIQLAELLSKDKQWTDEEKKALQELKTRETSLKATLEERKRNLLKHEQSEIRPSDELETKVYLSGKQQEAALQIEQSTKRRTEIDLALATHKQGKERIKIYEKALSEKEALSENWKRLNDLFGSASGSKFKEMAQGYTLDALLWYANKHLQELSKRYELRRIPDTLALQVADLDMLGDIRTVHSLSGGESFLISLALALGLSSLSSQRMKVESLFIDEGFGSLDVETLRVAMDALERLQTQGRKIGVISHVPEMTERITTQIHVTKTSNGKSIVKISNSKSFDL